MKKYKKVFLGFIVFVFLLIYFNCFNITVNAEVNKNYGTQVQAGQYQDAQTNSEPGTILGLLCSAILQVGRLIESIVAWLMQLLSSNSDEGFPWSDRIIFNTIPVLDVNFINPADGSLFKMGNGEIGNIVRNIYFTGLSIAVGFLSIVVGVMAIRMAISTIAAQKARYKESIVTFLTALVLLFGTHFLLSFTFYLNETMVELASTMVKNAVPDNFTIGSTASSEDSEVISSLGNYFYTTAYDQGGDANFVFFKIDKAAPIPTVLYLMFVIQSLMFLFAYFKRFFYVLILSILAPFVVIYDFLGKAIS